MRSRLAAVVLGWAAGGALLALAAAQPWSATPAADLAPAEPVAGPGAARAVGVAALAAAAALPLLRATGRRVLGGIGVLLGAAGVATVLDGWPAPAPAWPWLALAGGVLVAVAGALTVARAGSWPGTGTRFERGARTDGAAPRDAWDALDRGEDPTT